MLQDDGNGKMIPVEITETIYYNSNSGMVPMSFSPLAKIGETRSYTVKVSNEMMGIPGTVGKGCSCMNSKFNISLAILQIIAGILGSVVFFKSILNYGELTITMTILSFFLMVFGLLLGFKGLYKIKKR